MLYSVSPMMVRFGKGIGELSVTIERFLLIIDIYEIFHKIYIYCQMITKVKEQLKRKINDFYFFIYHFPTASTLTSKYFFFNTLTKLYYIILSPLHIPSYFIKYIALSVLLLTTSPPTLYLSIVHDP